MIIDEKCFKYFLVYFFLPSTHTHWKNHILRAYGFWTDCGISVSWAKCTQPIAMPQIDRYVKINRNFPTFERLVTVLYKLLIRIQMHFVLLTTISLLFVRGGTFIAVGTYRPMRICHCTIYGWCVLINRLIMNPKLRSF